MKTRIRVEANLSGPARLVEDSVQLFQVDELGNPVGDALCTMLDNGDSRNGDAKAGDSIYSCFAWLAPRWKANIGLIVHARRRTPKGVEVPMTSKIFLIAAVDGEKKIARENESEQDRIMRQAREIWAGNKGRFGLTDAAVAVTVREIKEVEGVRDVRLNTGNDITVFFKVGGREQLPTFDPK